MNVRVLAGLIGACLVALPLADPAMAQSPGPSPVPDHMPPPRAMSKAEMEQRANHRFPQLARAGSLIGRDLLQPVEAQPVLGQIVGLARREDGMTTVVVRLDGWLGLGRLGVRGIDWGGIGPRRVAVPIEAVALLGEYVALMDLTPERLRALPTFVMNSQPAVGPDESIRIGLVRPFH